MNRSAFCIESKRIIGILYELIYFLRETTFVVMVFLLDTDFTGVKLATYFK